MLAAVAFLGLLSTGAAAYVVMTSEEGDDPDASAEAPDPAAPEAGAASEPKATPAVVAADSDRAPEDPVAAKPVPRSLDEVVWTTDAPSTLRELGRSWSIPRDALAQLNPDLGVDNPLEAGVRVVVHAGAPEGSLSVGPPNNGRLVRGVPLPEAEIWALPEDRSRAFATADTLESLTAALDAYGQQFPDAQPIQLGDLSARRGGKIYGHQSHQTGLDVDIRLVTDAAGDGFDAGRNWFLIKTLLDGGDVTAIFLNATEQTWLRAAAESDVGAASATKYFDLIQHEPGHTIHTHIRFTCPKANKRCVNYPLPDTDEQDAKRKLPPRLGGKSGRGTVKLPRRKTTRGGRLPTSKRKGQ